MKENAGESEWAKINCLYLLIDFQLQDCVKLRRKISAGLMNKSIIQEVLFIILFMADILFGEAVEAPAELSIIFITSHMNHSLL